MIFFPPVQLESVLIPRPESIYSHFLAVYYHYRYLMSNVFSNAYSRLVKGVTINPILQMGTLSNREDKELVQTFISSKWWHWIGTLSVSMYI